MLMDLKGYRRRDFEARAQVLRQALIGEDEVGFAKLTASLQELRRPVAAVLESSNRYGQWLRSSHEAELLYGDGRTVVWLLWGPARGPASTAASATSHRLLVRAWRDLDKPLLYSVANLFAPNKSPEGTFVFREDVR
jgi:hypothetical protein